MIRRLALPAIPAALLLLPLPLFAQGLGRPDDDGVSVWRVLAALIFCILLAVAAALILRSRGHGFPLGQAVVRRRRLRLIEAVRLPNQTSLCLVAVDDRELLLSTSAAGVHLVPTRDGGGDGADRP